MAHEMPAAEHSIDIKKHVRTYVSVFVALLALTLITVAVSYLRLAIVPALCVALFIAVVKGSLVASYFMHLINERRLIYAVLILTAIFFVALMFLPLSHMSDNLAH